MRISDWSSDVCSSDLAAAGTGGGGDGKHAVGAGRAMSATKANHEGGCACGAVRYRAAGDLRPVVACHCSQCRKAFTNYGAFTAVERARSEEHTSELQSLMRISYAVFCLKKKNTKITQKPH